MGWVLLVLREEGSTESSDAWWRDLIRSCWALQWLSNWWELTTGFICPFKTRNLQPRNSPEHPGEKTYSVNYWKISNFCSQDKNKWHPNEYWLRCSGTFPALASPDYSNRKPCMKFCMLLLEGHHSFCSNKKKKQFKALSPVFFFLPLPTEIRYLPFPSLNKVSDWWLLALS